MPGSGAEGFEEARAVVLQQRGIDVQNSELAIGTRPMQADAGDAYLADAAMHHHDAGYAGVMVSRLGDCPSQHHTGQLLAVQQGDGGDDDAG